MENTNMNKEKLAQLKKWETPVFLSEESKNTKAKPTSAPVESTAPTFASVFGPIS
jgi:hypothetical protein